MKQVLIYADSSNSAPFRYRCSNIVEILELSKTWKAECIVGDFEKAKEKLINADILIIERQTDKTGQAKKLIKLAKKHQISVGYDVDDLVFHPKYTPILTKSTGSINPLYWFMYSLANFRLARLADFYIATNDFLAKKLSGAFHKPARIIPNFLNKAQIDVSEKIQKKTKDLDNSSFCLGYFSGSPTHSRDFDIIEPEVIKFLHSHKDAKLLIVGDLPISKELDIFETSGQLEVKEKVDYISLQKLISTVDINLVPLVINDFTNCKSELKFFESAIVNVVTLASPTFAYKTSIEDDKTGFLCNNDDWRKTLEKLYSDKETLSKVAESAKKYCLENYYGQNIISKIEKVYDEFKK